MTREDLFRAVGEVREDQIEAAETVRKQIHPWRRLGALAACLALAAGISAAPWLGERMKWRAIEHSFEPSIVEKGESAGGGSDADGGPAGGSLDGSSYWTDGSVQPAKPNYSTGVEIGELAGPGNGDTMIEVSACLVWLSQEEIFAQDTAIFRGIVRELRYFIVEPDFGGMGCYYTRAIVEVTDPIWGGLEAGETYSLLWVGARGYMSTSVSGVLEDLDVGSDAVFMPIRTDQSTGWRTENGWFCYADVAELYLEGGHYVFADTGDGLDFERSAYPDLAEAETLDEVAAYIREQLKKVEGIREYTVLPGEEEPEPGGYVFVEGTEQSQPAAEPVMPQTEPSETANAGPSASGPAGAREVPGGALTSGEKPGGSP